MNDSAGETNKGILFRKIGIYYEVIGKSAEVLSKITGIPYILTDSKIARIGVSAETKAKSIFSILETHRITYLVINNSGLSRFYYGKTENYDAVLKEIDNENNNKNSSPTENKTDTAQTDNSDKIKTIEQKSVETSSQKSSFPAQKKKKIYTRTQVRTIKARMKKEKRNACFVTGIIAITSTILFILMGQAVHKVKLQDRYEDAYRTGQSLYDKGDYENAKNCFESIPDEAGYRTDIYVERIKRKKVESRCKDIGSWMRSTKSGDKYSSIYSCIYCGSVFDAEKDESFPYKYCPNCGEKMIEDNLQAGKEL